MTLIEIEMGCTKIDRVLFLQFDCCLISIIYFHVSRRARITCVSSAELLSSS